MNRISVLVTLIGLSIGCSVQSFAQFEAAVPFLMLTSSAEGNGMGGISSSVVTSNAMAVIANPGQLGLQSLNQYFSASTYTPKTDWLQQFHQPDLTFNSTAVNFGLNMGKLVGAPFTFSMGLGYSRTRLNYGKFYFTRNDPTPIDSVSAFEQSENMTIGFGVEYGFKFGFGVSAKNIESSLFPSNFRGSGTSGTAYASAYDIGAILHVPVMNILSKFKENPITIGQYLKPIADITFAYSRRSIGGMISYLDFVQPDALPRTATVGICPTIGLKKDVGDVEWEFVSVTLAREAEDVLVIGPRSVMDSLGNVLRTYPPYYEEGGGHLQAYRNLILGESDGKILIRKGWQIGIAEFLYVRGGSAFGNGFNYTTEGFSIRLGGIFKLLQNWSDQSTSGTCINFLMRHVDLQYDHASEGGYSPRSGTTYNSLNVVFR